MRREREKHDRKECERQREISGRSLGGIALPEVGTHQFPGGRRGPSTVTYIFILSIVTPQHFREDPKAGGQGHGEHVSSHTSPREVAT